MGTEDLEFLGEGGGSRGLVKLLRDLMGEGWKRRSRTGKGLCFSSAAGCPQLQVRAGSDGQETVPVGPGAGGGVGNRVVLLEILKNQLASRKV